MNQDPIFPFRWANIADFLRTQTQSDAIQFPVQYVEHPLDAGMHPSFGLPVGQRAEFRLILEPGLLLVVQDFGEQYLAHLEHAPEPASFEKTLRDAPGSSVAGLTALGALIGLAIGRSKESALVGAAVGGLAGLAGVSVANAETSPATSDAAGKFASTVVQASGKARSPESSE